MAGFGPDRALAVACRWLIGVATERPGEANQWFPGPGRTLRRVVAVVPERVGAITPEQIAQRSRRPGWAIPSG